MRTRMHTHTYAHTRVANPPAVLGARKRMYVCLASLPQARRT